MCLHYIYGVKKGNVFGIKNGYRGFYMDDEAEAAARLSASSASSGDASDGSTVYIGNEHAPSTPCAFNSASCGPDGGAWITLTPESVAQIHLQGGTILGSSRGGFDADKILASAQRRGINILFVLGGDGTHRGALALQRAVVAKGMRLCIACVPKTIDGDIPIIDKSFGFETAVEQSLLPITCAHTEALACQNGVGLVRLMGRQSGFIAMHASLASRDVNVTLLPEAPWRIASLNRYLETRLKERGHCLIVVAEGAEPLEKVEERQRIVAEQGAQAIKTDESGNPVLEDVGVMLKDAITQHFKKAGKPIKVTYIDPSYIIRSSAPNAADSHLCTTLAFNAVHGAFAGRTAFSVGTVDNTCVLIPLEALATLKPRQVDTDSRIYARLCSTTGQPFLG
jgi:6-phosphofructokinase 1